MDEIVPIPAATTPPEKATREIKPIPPKRAERPVLPPDLYRGLKLEPVVSSARRADVPSSAFAGDVSVVTADQIARLPAADPGEVLHYMPGVDMDARTKFGHFRPLTIRGSESRHVLVMVDGIPFNTQVSGQADVLPTLPLNNVRRIEVLKGAGSSVWGSALGGAVNVLTKSPQDFRKPRRRVTTKFSEFGTLIQEFDAGGHLGDLGYYFAGTYTESGGARSAGNTATREDTLHKKFFGKLTHPVTDQITSTASFGYSGADVNEGVFQQTLTRTEMPYVTRYGQVRLDYDPAERQHFEAAFKMNRQTIQSRTFFVPLNLAFPPVRNRDYFYGLSLKSVTAFERAGTLVAGYDLSTNVLKSTLMDESRDVVIQAPYVNHDVTLGPATITTALRYDDNGEFGSEISPAFGVVYRVPGVPETLIRVNAARGFHAPPLLWKFFEDTAPGLTANNPDIRAERAWVYEAGVETRPLPGLWIKTTAYRADVSDAIATVLNPAGFFIKDNFDKFRQTGFEFQSRYEVPAGPELFFAANFNDVEDRATRTTVRGRGVTRPSFRVGFDWDHPSGFQLGLWGTYDRWDAIALAEPNDRKFIFDARIARTFKKLWDGRDVTIFLNIYNLTNSKYWNNINLPLPERYFEGGVTLDF